MSEQHRGRPLNNEAGTTVYKLLETLDESIEKVSTRLGSENELVRQLKVSRSLLHNGAHTVQEGGRILRAVLSEHEATTLAFECGWTWAQRGSVVVQFQDGKGGIVMNLGVYAPQICACLKLDQEQFVPIIILVLEGSTCAHIARTHDVREDVMKGWLKTLREESKRFAGRPFSSRATVREAVLEALVVQLVTGV